MEWKSKRLEHLHIQNCHLKDYIHSKIAVNPEHLHVQNGHLKYYIHRKIAVNPEKKTEFNKTKKCQVKNKIPIIVYNGQTLFEEDLKSLNKRQRLTDSL